MQIVEAVRQWWSVQPCLRKLEALGPVARAELARDNAIPEADLPQLAANSEIDSALLPDCSSAWGSIQSHWLAGGRALCGTWRSSARDAR